MSICEITAEEIDQVTGAVTASEVLNYGAAVTGFGAAVLVGVGFVAGAPMLAAGAAAYGVVSAGMWLGSAHMGMFN